MKKISAIFLQAVISVVGAGALVLMLAIPHFEGRNANATLFQIYFKDPFLVFAYAATIPFFIGLWKTFTALSYVKQDRICSQEGVRSLRTIKYCAMAMIGFVVVSVVFMPLGDDEDRPPGIFMRGIIMLPSIVIAASAAMFEQILKEAVDVKSRKNLAG